MSQREIKLVWINTSIAAPAKNQKPKREERTSASDAIFKLVGAGGSIVIVLGFAFWLGVLSNSITAQKTLFTEKLTTFTKQLDRIEKDLDGVKEAQYFPKAKEIGIPNPKISFARARATETFNVSYPGVEGQNRPPMDVTFRIEEIGDKFVKLKPQVFYDAEIPFGPYLINIHSLQCPLINRWELTFWLRLTICQPQFQDSRVNMLQ